jgi:hypothetical protein
MNNPRSGVEGLFSQEATMRAKLLLLGIALIVTMSGCKERQSSGGTPADTTAKRDSIPMQ